MQTRSLPWKAFLFRLSILFLLGIPAFCLVKVVPAILYVPANTQTQMSKQPDNNPALSTAIAQYLLTPYPSITPTAPITPTPTSTPIPAPSHATLASFVGDWGSHLGRFTVKPDGHASIIFDGFREEILFTTVTGVTAHGKIVASTTGDVGKQVTATLEANDTVEVPGYNIFCGPHAPLGYCGA